MFESLAVLGRDRTLARKAWSFPVAVALHGVAVALLLLYSLAAPVTLLPPCEVFLQAPALVIPVQLGGFRSEPAKPAEPVRAAAATPDPRRLVEPETEPDPNVPPSDAQGFSFDGEYGVLGDGPAGPGSPLGVVGGQLPGGPDPDAAPNQSTERLILRDLGKVSALRALSESRPTYPPALMSLRLAGRVELELVVDEDGRVESVTVLSATHPLFAEAAAAAVRTWRYHPPVSGQGTRVAVMRRVVVNFSPR